jgi:hypothetical protein
MMALKVIIRRDINYNAPCKNSPEDHRRTFCQNSGEDFVEVIY